MAEITADRVYETSTTTGTGSYTLAGAISGYRAFSAVCANGDTVRCFVEEVDANGVPNGGWEVGIYTWGTGGVLARTTIEASSNSNAAVSWAAGTRRIGLGVTASRLASMPTGWTSSLNTTTPNDTNFAARLLATGSSATIDAVVSPKGTGALLAQLATASGAGGNKRGASAVDWQMSRSLASAVASGDYSVIAGGSSNRASTLYSTVGGGQLNLATQEAATICGGKSNAASGYYSVISGGTNNIASGENASVTGGSYNNASAYGSRAGGYGAVSRSIRGADVYACFGTGSGQRGAYVLGLVTIGATPATLVADGAGSVSATNQVLLPIKSAFLARGRVVASKSDGTEAKAWTFDALLLQGANAATTALASPVSPVVVSASGGASTWDLAISADTTRGGLSIVATGQASTSIQWTAVVDTVESWTP